MIWKSGVEMAEKWLTVAQSAVLAIAVKAVRDCFAASLLLLKYETPATEAIVQAKHERSILETAGTESSWSICKSSIVDSLYVVLIECCNTQATETSRSD